MESIEVCPPLLIVDQIHLIYKNYFAKLCIVEEETPYIVKRSFKNI
jgi:hypothetical protein